MFSFPSFWFENQFLEVAKSTCLVITKTNENNQTNEEILGQIKEVLEKNSYLSVGSKKHDFLKQILEKQKVRFFPIPKDITKETINDIEALIESLPAHKLRNLVKFSPSEKVKVFLQQMIFLLAQKLKINFQSVAKKITEKYQKRYLSANDADSAKKLLLSIEKILNPLPDWKEFSAKSLLEQLELPASEATLSDSLLGKLKELLFIYPNIDLKYHVDASSIISAISNSKNHAGNEASRIRNQIEMERLKRERERQAQQERIRQQQERERYQAQLQKEKEERDRKERLEAQERARKEREERERCQRERKEAQARAHQAWLNSQRRQDSSSDNCLIM